MLYYGWNWGCKGHMLFAKLFSKIDFSIDFLDRNAIIQIEGY